MIPGGPQPYASVSPAAQTLGLLPGASALPGLGNDLVNQVEEEAKLRKKKLAEASPLASPAASLLLGGTNG